jgi:hypothetical protein
MNLKENLQMSLNRMNKLNHSYKEKIESKKFFLYLIPSLELLSLTDITEIKINEIKKRKLIKLFKFFFFLR